MAATTVKDWSDGSTTLRRGAAGPSIRNLRTLLNQAGIDMTKYPVDDPDLFDMGLEEAVCEFQKMSMDMDDSSTKLGIVDDLTLNCLINSASMMGDLSYYENVAETDPEGSPDGSVEGNPHYDSFFNGGNTKTYRKNATNIRIVLGANGIVKTLHDVYMRSVGVEYDTSGNPICETYEFIARDMTESDNAEDNTKYD